ncbi:CBS domain-containing protein, partial [Enterobacter sp. JH586]|uniref:CBS domain-containing protein n=1 Tax=Enterobacter sp. JH586 TaxID=2923094 RepID=UPI00208FA8A1
RVKKFESGIVSDPITVRPEMTLRDLAVLSKKNGFAGYPVTTESGELVGIVTGRDVRFVTDLDRPVTSVMTPKERLVTVKENEPREEAFSL